MRDQSEVRENRLIAALSSESLERLLPSMERVVLPPGEILYNFDDELTHIYFPDQNTVVSSLCTTDEHTAVEVGLCGNEGAVGIAALFGAETASQQNLVQVPGSGSRLTLSAAKTEFRVGGRFQGLVLRFAHAFFVQVAQTALCNRVHSDEERLALAAPKQRPSCISSVAAATRVTCQASGTQLIGREFDRSDFGESRNHSL
jgi:hypothetical protein